MEGFINGKGPTQKGFKPKGKPDFDVRLIFAILNPVNRAVAYSTELSCTKRPAGQTVSKHCF